MKNKFDAVVEKLNENENEQAQKTHEIVKKIAGKSTRKTAEERKVLPTYIPMSLYLEFDEITTAYGISNNAAICQLIRDYVTDKRKILEK